MIVVLGSINIDIRFQVAHLPGAGQTIHALGQSYFAGGKGANQALAAKRAGAEVAMFGVAGDEPLGKIALSELAASGVPMTDIALTVEGTGAAYIYVDSQGENCIVINAGANALVDAKMAAAAVERAKGGYLVLQQEIPTDTIKTALDLARAAGVRTILNVSPFDAASPVLARLADIVIANETEWEMLAGKMDTPASLQDHSRKHHQAVVVTKGAQGVCVATGDDYFELPAPRIRPVDTVGAGDTFCGYLAAALAAGQTWRRRKPCLLEAGCAALDTYSG
jgi:ribokinase